MKYPPDKNGDFLLKEQSKLVRKLDNQFLLPKNIINLLKTKIPSSLWREIVIPSDSISDKLMEEKK